MSLGTSEDHQHFTCTIWRPQGKSYLYFTQFKAEVRGAEIEYGMAYVSIGCAQWGGCPSLPPWTVPFSPLGGRQDERDTEPLEGDFVM